MKAAPIEAVSLEVTGFVVMVNVTELEPAATVTEAGRIASADVELSDIWAPPAGATPVNTIDPVEDAPPITLDGLRLMDEMEMGVMVRVAV